MTNTFQVFASFTEASAFARSVAIERQCWVSVFQHGDKWRVEVLGMLDSTASETNIAPEKANPKLKYRPAFPRKFGSIIRRIADSRRREGTRAEIELERILLNVCGGRFRGRFQREWAYGGRWLVDFYFPEVRLGIEVDDSYRNASQKRYEDKERQKAFEKSGITIMRLTNDEVFGDRESLLLKLFSGWRKAKIASRDYFELNKPIQRRPILPSRSPRPQYVVSAPSFNGGWTSLKQGENRVGDAYEKVYISEGIAGSRDEQRAMNKQQFSDMRKRSRGE